MSTLWCTVCGEETAHEAVPCQDGHGGDCPEVVCVGCGYVAVIGAVVEPTPSRPAASAA
jgi:hypothetical protein